MLYSSCFLLYDTWVNSNPDYWNACYPKCAAYVNIAFYYATNSWKHRLCKNHVFLRACSRDTGCLRRAAWKAACDLLLRLSLTPWSEICVSDSLVWDLCLWLPGLRSVSLTPWSEICVSDSLVWDLCLWAACLFSHRLGEAQDCSWTWLPAKRQFTQTSSTVKIHVLYPQTLGSEPCIDMLSSLNVQHCMTLMLTIHIIHLLLLLERLYDFLIHICSLMTTDNEIRKG